MVVSKMCVCVCWGVHVLSNSAFIYLQDFNRLMLVNIPFTSTEVASKTSNTIAEAVFPL